MEWYNVDVEINNKRIPWTRIFADGPLEAMDKIDLIIAGNKILYILKKEAKYDVAIEPVPLRVLENYDLNNTMDYMSFKNREKE